MKFDLTIKDATQQEVARVLNLLNGHSPEFTVLKAEVDLPDTPAPVPTAKEVSSQIETTHIPVETQSTVCATPLPLAQSDDVELITQPKVAPKIESGEGVDADQLPWDGRIHSSNKEKTKDGLWRKKRGRTDEEYQAVKAELLGQSEPVATTPALNPPPPPKAARDFPAILNRVQKGFQQGKCTPAYIPTLVEKLKAINPNIAAVTDVAGDDELIAAVHNIMDADGIE